MTLEGCVVRISDIIGYIGRDIEDADELNIFDIKNLPKDITDVLGNTNSEIINTIILDIIKNSINKPYIKLSDNIYKAIDKLKDFNYENIYYKANTKEDIENYKMMFKLIFDKCLIIVNNNLNDYNIYHNFLKKQTTKYLNNNSDVRKVIDYIAGMTDDYFFNEYEMLKSTNLK